MDYINIAYVVSAVCFIFGIKMLSHPKTARKGNGIATLGMLVAIAATLYAGEVLDFKMIGYKSKKIRPSEGNLEFEITLEKNVVKKRKVRSPKKDPTIKQQEEQKFPAKKSGELKDPW